jgi:beta-phosphoglucomutase-like phosphatase (HAD superfamily)
VLFAARGRSRLDGLILDTETPIFEAWRTVYGRRGQELKLEVWQHALGTHGGFDPHAHLGALLGQALPRRAARGGAGLEPRCL